MDPFKKFLRAHCLSDGKNSKRKSQLLSLHPLVGPYGCPMLLQLSLCFLQMIEDVLGEGPVSASRFSRWFSSNLSPSGSRSSRLRSTPHEELERLAGKDQTNSQVWMGIIWVFTIPVPNWYLNGSGAIDTKKSHKMTASEHQRANISIDSSGI